MKFADDSSITVTDQATKTQLDTINGYTTTAVSVATITGTLTEITALHNDAGLDISGALINVTDAVSLSQANTLNGYTTGQVTLTSVSDTVSNITAIDALTTSEVTMAAAAVSITDTGATKAQVDAVKALSLIHI